jgi:ribosomal protein S18 acetylase RimI-like enzyme
MQIRPYTVADEPAIIELWTAEFGYDAPHRAPAFALACKREVQPELLFVATAEGASGASPRIIGTAMGGYDGHRGWLYSLAVHRDFRRQGIATALVRQVEAALAALGCPKLNLQVIPGNQAALAFYAALGYALDDRISFSKFLPRGEAAHTRT